MPEIEFIIRKAQDCDAPELIKLIGGCFAEYDGCVLDLEGIDNAMLAIDSYVDKYEGEFWLALEGDVVVGSVGYIVENGKMELIKLYVDKTMRRKGLATTLLNLVLSASQTNSLEVDLWSDTRFVEAHAFYAHHGFTKQEETRFLNDPSNSWEFHFIRSTG
ncbi:MAG: GNAT family N-acetyltransferase [Sphingomonadales bacterium]|nr:GNAT family N-acetyltransferase [Sphingomonadales bacterium]